MTKIKYKASADKDAKTKNQVDFYESTDIDQAFDFKKKKLVLGQITKRVNIVLPEPMYKLALDIGTMAGTGYQNALKMAIVIGLNELKDKTKQKIR